MLSKLLRHEFRATGRIMLPVYALLLVSCGGCTLFGRLLGRYPESTVLSVVQTVFATLFGVTTFGMLLLTLVLMVYRFYKNLMTDEGYLMFTLPVSRSQLIWSTDCCRRTRPLLMKITSSSTFSTSAIRWVEITRDAFSL